MGPLQERVQHMAGLVEDVFTLAEYHVPNLVVRALRARFRQRRALIGPPADFRPDEHL